MLLDLIRNRKCVREYQDKKISKDNLKKILEAGRLAPSWMNVQSWKFIVIENQETKNLLFELSGHQQHVKNAPIVIACIADKNSWAKEEFAPILQNKGLNADGIERVLTTPAAYPVLRGEKITLLRSVEQVTYAIAYMMLTAKDLGIDSCIVGAIQNEATGITTPELMEKINKALNLSKDDVFITMLPLGYAAKDEKNNKQRKDFDKVVFFEKVGNPLD